MPETMTMPLDAIVPADYNPRSITPEARAALRESIRRFGQATTLTWNRRTQRLVGGHQRAAIMREMGYTEAQVSVVDVSEAEERALNLALNSPELAGQWDNAKLDAMLAQLRAQDAALFDKLRLGEIAPALATEARRAQIETTKATILAEAEHQQAQVDADAIIEALAHHVRKIAEHAPERLLCAFAVVLPLRRGHEVLVLADPNTADAATELRRYAEAGHPSPVEALFSGLLDFHDQAPTTDAEAGYEDHPRLD